MIQTFKEIAALEKEQLRKRRQKLEIDPGKPNQENWFGIALSGGGIRSATINLGLLKTLNRFGILQKADYLSTVSGGGYTHSYVQGTAKTTGDFNALFTTEQIDAMRKHGEYLIPGQGFRKNLNTLLLTIAFAVSWMMSLISPVIVLGIMYMKFLRHLPAIRSAKQQACYPGLAGGRWRHAVGFYLYTSRSILH